MFMCFMLTVQFSVWTVNDQRHYTLSPISSHFTRRSRLWGKEQKIPFCIYCRNDKHEVLSLQSNLYKQILRANRETWWILRFGSLLVSVSSLTNRVWAGFGGHLCLSGKMFDSVVRREQMGSESWLHINFTFLDKNTHGYMRRTWWRVILKQSLPQGSRTRRV